VGTPATWRLLPYAPLSGVRLGFPTQAVWDGHEMLLVTSRWDADRSSCNEVGVAYDPSTDGWRSLPTMPHTGACADPLTTDMAVWTGKELLLWGVADAAFNPATNRWRALPDPPTGWGGPAFAVWTGHQMIGWGGGGGDLLLHDGAAYTPATNSWRKLPPAPLSGSGRRGIAGVWTGREVIVAGGIAPSNRGERVYPDAAAYDPRSNTWRRLAPMPVAEWGANALWDGTEVLLLQGTRHRDALGSTVPMRRGLAYDPAADRWHRIASMRYPRYGSIAVWTGRHVIVWGGLSDRVPPYGEIYDPTGDTWTTMPPSPLRGRYDPVAAWTGSSLIVWGGQDARTWERLSGGAVFTPASG
jgi:galactose oxidase-like protein